MTTKQTPQEKSNIVIEFFNASIFVTKICRKHNISPTMFQNWNEKFLQEDKQALADKGILTKNHSKEIEISSV